MKKQIHFEAVRGIAAMVVVAHHLLWAFYPASIVGPGNTGASLWERAMATTPLGIIAAGSSAVFLFFILSGYVLSLSFFGPQAKGPERLLGNLIKRPFRLLGLVYFTEILAVILGSHGLFGNERVALSTHSEWFANLWKDFPSLVHGLRQVLLNPFTFAEYFNGPLWTIEVELYGSVLTFIFLLLFARSRWRPFGYLAALVIFRHNYEQAFLFGIFFADIEQNQRLRLEKLDNDFASLGMLAAGLFLCSYPVLLQSEILRDTCYGWMPRQAFGIFGGYAVIGSLLVFAAVLISKRLQRHLAHPALAFLGRISFAVYTIHFLILGSVSCWLFLWLPSGWSFNLRATTTIGFSLGLTLLAAYAITRWLDEPVQRLSNIISSKWSASLIPSKSAAPEGDQ